MTFLNELGKASAWVIAISIASLVFGGLGLLWWEGFSEGVSDGTCTIAVIPIQGEITAYPDTYTAADGSVYPLGANQDTFGAAVRAAEDDTRILGILVPIDSGGGAPASSEGMMKLLKGSPLPSVALIREAGDSGAYLAATGASTIIASPFADVGSIGVTMSYLENTKQNTENGLSYVSLTSAPYKDAGNPDAPLTAAERALFERDLKIYHQVFVDEVAENRGIATDTVAALADGSAMPASLALDHKLIDQIGGEAEARAWFAQELKMDPADVVFCK